MTRRKIITFSLLLSSFLLLLSLIKIIFTFSQFSKAENGGPQCTYLKWSGSWAPNIIPQTTSTADNNYYLMPSPIKTNGPSVEIGSQLPGLSITLRVFGTATVQSLCFQNGTDCRSSWQGAGNWLLNSSQGFLYPSSSLWKVSIGTTSNIVPSTTLHVFGKVTADQFIGTINAGNISSGIFGSLTGGGNFIFPANIFATSGQVRAKEICIGEVCYQNWPSLYSITTRFPFYNGLYYPPTTSWPSVYPVTSRDFVKRNLTTYNYPYLSFNEIIGTLLPSDSSATVTDWFDIAYGYHDVNQPNYEKALYVEESDNSMPVNVYFLPLEPTTTCSSQVRLKRLNCKDLFLGATYYDSQGVLRSTSSEKFLIEKCFNPDPTDGCSGPGPSLGNFIKDPSSNTVGRVILELRVVPWQRPSSTYACNDKVYFPSIRLQSWNRPHDVFFKIGKYKLVTSSNDVCATAALKSKVQGRFIVEPLKVLYWDGGSTEDETTTPVSSLVEIKNFLYRDSNYAFGIGDFVYVFKEIGISLLSVVSK